MNNNHNSIRSVFVGINTNINSNSTMHHTLSDGRKQRRQQQQQRHVKTNMVKHTLCYFIVMICITRQILVVDAIRCHQCNSHTDENCISLHTKSSSSLEERSSDGDKYLKECTDEAKNSKQAFCRKTVLKIEVNGEQRVIRSCGWMYDRTYMANTSCFSADNEGYTQIICACHEDGCNVANNIMESLVIKWLILGSITAFVLI